MADLVQVTKAIVNSSQTIEISRASYGLYQTLKNYRSYGTIGIPANICHEVIAAIKYSGWSIFHVDIEPESGVPGKNDLQVLKGQKVDAFLLVHLFGIVNNSFDFLKTIIPDALIIEDVAQAFGACYADGVACGLKGDVGLFSFGETKQFPIGGGLLKIRNATLFKSVYEKVAQDSSSHPSVPDTEKEIFDKAVYNFRQNSDITDFKKALPSLNRIIGQKKEFSIKNRILEKLDFFADEFNLRQQKFYAWTRILEPTPLNLIPVGLNASPWRAVAIIPDISVNIQQLLADDLRSKNIDVSHWYYPSIWFDETNQECPGAKRFQRQVFQFWIDGKFNLEDEKSISKIILDIFEKHEELFPKIK